MTVSSPRVLLALLAAFVAAARLVAAQGGTFPARLDSYLTADLRLSRNERQRLLNGELISRPFGCRMKISRLSGTAVSAIAT